MNSALDNIGIKVVSARAAFSSGRTKSLEWRKAQLTAVVRLIDESADRFEAALKSDLGKNPIDSFLTEITSVVDEAKHAIKKLPRWTRDVSVGSPITLWPCRAAIHREPLGTVLIIGPWNYPVHLIFMPLIGALAAGNSVVLKPSELAPECSRLIAELVPRYLDAEAIQVIEGDVKETTELLTHQFDHIFYTGNGTVGSIVMQAAAKHLCPVTLELGGKSPVWVDESFPLERAAKTIAWGKFSNCGQTCVAPDYILTTPALAPLLANAVARAIKEFYGNDPIQSPDYARIINERHTQRLANLLQSGRVIAGGTADIGARYVAPTVLIDVLADSPVMKDEIFGPILPILTVADHVEAIKFINARPKPLALYGFTNHEHVRDAMLKGTSSGGIAFGAVMIQLGVKQLPFGGVGPSGMGAYHGEHSFLTFSHQRSVLRKFGGPDITAMVRPPFTGWKQKLLHPPKKK
jgi:aldehyde dehydrogenase (NAD+)